MSDSPHDEDQRERLLLAMAEVVAERGYARTSLAAVLRRAQVSRRAFDRLYGSREDCFAALLDLGLQYTVALVTPALRREQRWQDGMRLALASLLVLFDSEPLLARVWLVESLAAGAPALEHRERNLRVLRQLVLERWPASAVAGRSPLAAEGVIGSVLGVIHTRISTRRPDRPGEPLIDLLGPLMALVTGPFLAPDAVAAEVQRGAQLARAIRAGEVRLLPATGTVAWGAAGRAAWPPAGWGSDRARGRGGLDAAQRPPEGLRQDLPPMLQNPNAHRARHCLRYLAAHPGACNREIAAGIGIQHQSQTSKLLADLLHAGLVARRRGGAGRRNAWRLSEHGERVVRALADIVQAPLGRIPTRWVSATHPRR